MGALLDSRNVYVCVGETPRLDKKYLLHNLLLGSVFSRLGVRESNSMHYTLFNRGRMFSEQDSIIRYVG